MRTSSQPSYALLADGSTIAIRAARPDDCGDVRQMHEQMSPDNTYLRFFSLSSVAPEREAQRICRPESPDHAALLAHREGRLVGVASYELTRQPGVAEIAFAVPDDMHGRGVATLLLEHLVSLARRRGLTAFSGETLPENRPMQKVFADAGLPVERHFSNGMIDVTIPLPNHDGAQLDHYLEAVATRASRADVASLAHLLRPASVAVIGAGRRRGSVGREILHNVVAGGFDGPIYAVNRYGRSMEGLACLASADDLPVGTELAVIAVPAHEVPAVAAQCGQKGVRALVVITSGLGAGGGADLLAICRRYGMRLVGPNCFGLATSTPRLNATFALEVPLGGAAGLVVQSGGVGIAMLEHLRRLGIGVSSFASVGDKYDVSSNDMLMWWEQDEETKLAILYVESFGNPRAFARTARRVGRALPVLTVVGGRSTAGQRAAASHTAASATPLVTQDALFRQAGIIATHSLGELVDATALLACQPRLSGRRVAIVSNAGGAGVLAADACGDCGLVVATLGSATRRRLARLLPPGAAVAGPVDTGAAVPVATFRACIEAVAADEGVDAVLVLEVPTAVADLRAAISTAQVVKPMAAVLLGQPESVCLLPLGTADDSATATGEPPVVAREPRRLPVYSYPENAASALAHAARYEEWRTAQHGQVPEFDDVDPAGAQAIAAAFLAANPEGGWLAGTDAASLVACYGVPVVATEPVADPASAVAAAARIGSRVVLKAEAAEVLHKTQAGAVRLDLRADADVAAAYAELAAAFGDRLQRVLVQPMVPGGVETIVGVVQEPVFGPLVVFGLGGVATDVLADRSARLTPLTDADAAAMIVEVRAAPLLTGKAGSPAVDTAKLAELLLRVSRLADDLPVVAELDLNPVIARPDGVYPVDVRVRLAPAPPHDPFLRQLR